MNCLDLYSLLATFRNVMDIAWNKPIEHVYQMLRHCEYGLWKVTFNLAAPFYWVSLVNSHWYGGMLLNGKSHRPVAATQLTLRQLPAFLGRIVFCLSCGESCSLLHLWLLHNRSLVVQHQVACDRFCWKLSPVTSWSPLTTRHTFHLTNLLLSSLYSILVRVWRILLPGSGRTILNTFLSWNHTNSMLNA